MPTVQSILYERANTNAVGSLLQNPPSPRLGRRYIVFTVQLLGRQIKVPWATHRFKSSGSSVRHIKFTAPKWVTVRHVYSYDDVSEKVSPIPLRLPLVPVVITSQTLMPNTVLYFAAPFSISIGKRDS